MIIGVPKEIKTHEYRVGMTPSGVEELKRDGHRILIEKSAGAGSGFSDGEYIKAGAEIVDIEKLFKESELVVKVKEPLPSEYDLLQNGQAIFTYLHLAPNPELTGVLLEKKMIAIGYETLEKDGTLPLLAPMSEIAGRMAPIMASYYLQRIKGGSGILPSGAVGVLPARILILGAGVVGTNAARTSLGLGMRVSVINRGIERLQYLDELFDGKIDTFTSVYSNIRMELSKADVVIGAVLVPGAKTPVLVTEEMLGCMKKGSVIVDVSVDQGGCIETSRPTTHDNPVYEVNGIIHYTVANMPAAYPRTSTIALTNRTLQYIETLCSMGIEKAIREDSELKSALNLYNGIVMHKGLAESMGMTRGRI